MTGTGGGGWGASVKDSTVQGVVERYAEWFGTVIEMFSTRGEDETDRGDGGKELIGEEGDEENIFQPYVFRIVPAISFLFGLELKCSFLNVDY